MAVNAAPSGKAPPGRLGFGSATMALATFPCRRLRVARRQQCGARRGRPAQRARGRVVSSTTAAARRRAVPRPEDGRSLHARAAGGRRLGRVPVPDDRSGPDQDGLPDRDPIRTGERCHPAPRRRVSGAAGRRCRGARAGREDPCSRLGAFRRDRRGRRLGRRGGRGVGGHLGAPGNDEGSI